jgi:hypothetical protein
VEHFRWIGPNWLIILLSRVNEDTKALIMLLLWRSWYHRNDIMHGKGLASIAGLVFPSRLHDDVEDCLSKATKQYKRKGKEKVDEVCDTLVLL